MSTNSFKLCRRGLHDFNRAQHLQCPDCKKARRRSPEGRAKSTESARLWRAKNMDHVRKYRNIYKTYHRCVKKQRTPRWADLKKIVEIYVACPPGHEVDHKIPLQSKIACGLHVPENLQYLPLTKNRSKGNRYYE